MKPFSIMYICLPIWFFCLQGNPIVGVHIFLYSDDVSEVECLQGTATGPRQERALCHAASDADGKFTFNSIPCGNYTFAFLFCHILPLGVFHRECCIYGAYTFLKRNILSWCVFVSLFVVCAFNF